MPPLKSPPIKPDKSMLFFHIWNANFSVTPINSQMYMTKPKQVQKKLSENTGKTFSVIVPSFTCRGGIITEITVHSEREKQSTPHWSSSCSSWYSYSKYSWSITCYPGHYCLRSCSSPSCWRLCLSGSGRSPCGVIAIIIIIIILNIVLSSIHKWITIFSITFSIHSHDLPCYCVRLICCSRFAGIEADNILI